MGIRPEMKLLQLLACEQRLEDGGPAAQSRRWWWDGGGFQFWRDGLNLSSWRRASQRGGRKSGEGEQLGDKARESFKKEGVLSSGLRCQEAE